MERRKETKLAGAPRRVTCGPWAGQNGAKRDVLYLGEDVSAGLSKGAGARPLAAELPALSARVGRALSGA